MIVRYGHFIFDYGATGIMNSPSTSRQGPACLPAPSRKAPGTQSYRTPHPIFAHLATIGRSRHGGWVAPPRDPVASYRPSSLVHWGHNKIPETSDTQLAV